MTENEIPNPDPLESNEPLFDPEDTPTRGSIPVNNHSAAKTPARGISLSGMPTMPKTNPSLRVKLPESAPKRGGISPFNLLILMAAGAITLIAASLYLQGEGQVPTPVPTRAAVLATATKLPPTPTTAPSATPSPLPPTPIPAAVVTDTTVPPDVVAEILRHPGITAPPAEGLFRMLNPFTIAPARSRSSIISYTIQPGDNLDKIGARFGLSVDTLIWNNDGIYVNRLLPGDTLTVLPQDGVLYRTTGDITIESIAAQFKVSPYVIIDSEYNPQLQRAKPSTLLPAGVDVMIPGGVSEKKAVYWDPGIQYEGGQDEVDSSGRTRRLGGSVSFGGGPGSCGSQPNGGGSGSFAIPLPPVYVVQRGFTSYHSGIDLSAPTGTTVFASDGGTVIFAGWSNWGYGNAVVVAHGRFLTLYGHMSSVAVSCGQTVSRGTPVGAVGSTGNSSGPHLHFEIRVGQQPDNPENYLIF